MNSLSDPKAPIKAICHCGAVTVTAPGHPKQPINECQCTICRRYGAEWAYYNTKEVKVDIQEGVSMGKYCWGDKSATFEWCQGCGCLMYWWPLEIPQGGDQMGLNSRMMEPDAIRGVDRKVDWGMLFEPLQKDKEKDAAENNVGGLKLPE